MTDLISIRSLVRAMFITLALVPLLPGCDRGLLVNEVREIPGEIWHDKDSLEFSIPVTDTLLPYDLQITLRHTVDYAYMNLFLFVDTEFPDQKMHRDTIELILAQPNGDWIGEGFGRLRYNRFLIRKALVFPDTGSYNFVFVQAMRTPALSGIRDLGIQMKMSDQGSR
jgi:gliding motility-associated lipoprotein GldH